jgi:hypothetical protein
MFSSFRRGILLGITLLGITLSALWGMLVTGMAQAQTRPPIGGIGQLPDAMIFYVAHGGADSCGPGCSDWIAAEGTVQFDTFKRLIAILDRHTDHKLPVVINSRGQSSLNVAVSLGRIMRDRGIDAMVGITEVEACSGKSEADCFALKRPGGPLDARENTSRIMCDLACALMLAGGIHRTLPPDSHLIVSGMSIRRQGLTALYTKQFRIYLHEMGVSEDLIDLMEQSAATAQIVDVPPSEWTRLHLATAPL